MLICFNVKKKHIIFQILYIFVGPLCPVSLKHCFLQSPSFRQVQSAVIGQLTQCIVIGRTPQARVGNITPLTIIASFSFQVSLFVQVSWQTQWWCSYVFAVHKPRFRWFLTGCTLRCDVTLFPSHSHTTRYA